MKSDRWVTWLTLLANIGVVVGIILLGFELQQNRAATLGDTQRSLLASLHDLDAWLRDPDFADVVVRTERDDELTDVEARQYQAWTVDRMNLCEHVFERYRSGIMTEQYWLGWDAGCRAGMASRAARQVWRSTRAWYGAEFAAYVEANYFGGDR